MITVSVVSHGHGALVGSLLTRLCALPLVESIIFTVNTPENLPSSSIHPKIRIIHNSLPKGYGQNHNAAFQHVKTPFFCILNPDISIITDPFPRLVEISKNQGFDLLAPVVADRNGIVQDSARHFPTLLSLARKLLSGHPGITTAKPENDLLDSDWLAGMFMFFKTECFARLSGFDERYFLYYEDVDICRRLRRQGGQLRQVLDLTVIHDARRDSRRKLKFAVMHARSAARFLLSR